MKVAVFGGGGFIGRHLIAALSRDGIAVLPVASTDPHCFHAASGVMRDDVAVDTQIGVVVYLSQSPHYRDVPARAGHVWNVNVASAITAAEWARRCGAARFIYVSSGSVYRPSFLPHREEESLRRDAWYPLSKVQAEEALALFARDMAVTSVRPFTVYGPGQRHRLVPGLIAAIDAGEAVYLQPHPDHPSENDGLRLSLAHVTDVVAVLRQVMTADAPPVLNIASDQVVDIRALAENIGALLGRPAHFRQDGSVRPADFLADTRALRRFSGRTFCPAETGLVETVDEFVRRRVTAASDVIRTTPAS